MSRGEGLLAAPLPAFCIGYEVASKISRALQGDVAT
jgi:hypothetical protein